MRAEEIVPNSAFGRAPRLRRIVAVEDDEVIYTVDGLATLVPLRMKIADFIHWAEQQNRNGESRHH